MRKRRHSEEEHENVERWLISYADFVTLLFCFFTAMYAISNVDSNKLGKFVESMRLAFNVSGMRGNAFSVIEGVQIFVPSNINIETDAQDVLGSLIADSNGSISVNRDKRGVTISVADKHFFQTGSAVLKDESREVLDEIAYLLSRYYNMIRIEGHTDNVPINSSEFPSNWELSSTRAINVAKYMINEHNIEPERISTVGYSEFRPVATNETSKGRSKNRRVDIVLLGEGESLKEP